MVQNNRLTRTCAYTTRSRTSQWESPDAPEPQLRKASMQSPLRRYPVQAESRSQRMAARRRAASPTKVKGKGVRNEDAEVGEIEWDEYVAAHATSKKRSRNYVESEVESEDDVESEVEEVVKKARTSAPRKGVPVIQEDSDSESDDDDEEVARQLKKRSTYVLPPTPKTTPRKSSRTTLTATPTKTPTRTPTRGCPEVIVEVIRPSPPNSRLSTPKASTPRQPKASTLKALPSPPSRTNAMDLDDDEDVTSSSSEDELTLQPSPTKTPKRVSSPIPTHRHSDRNLRLPVLRTSLADTPTNLRIDMVGCVGEIERLVSPPLTPSTHDNGPREEVVHETMYSTAHCRAMWDRMGSVLNGHSLPSPPRTQEGFDESKVVEYPCVQGLGEWEKPVRYAMEGVVKDGVGNCLIMLGPRGVGKTMIVERSMEVIEKVYGKGCFVPVRLNGLVQTTDRLALRSIARQLKSQGYAEETGDAGDFASNASTMSTLLRMLEPSDDRSESKDKPIIIIVDEFDLFALHPRQSFLYCLLDIVQGNRRKGGMGVIGISARTDCMGILEKRVRSRCQSQVHQIVLDNSWDDYLALASSLLRADEIAWREESEEQGDLAEEWNAEVEAFLEEEDVVEYLERLWRIHGNTPTQLRQALLELYYAVDWPSRHTGSLLSSPAPSTIRVPRLSLAMLPPPPAPGKRDDLLTSCTVLELTVCVASKHLRSNHDNMFNLEMLYDSYVQHTQRGKAIVIAARPYTKAQICLAFDNLRNLELILPYSSKPTHWNAPVQADTYKMYKFVPWASTLDEELGARSEVPQPLRRWNKTSYS